MINTMKKKLWSNQEEIQVYKQTQIQNIDAVSSTYGNKSG